MGASQSKQEIVINNVDVIDAGPLPAESELMKSPETVAVLESTPAAETSPVAKSPKKTKEPHVKTPAPKKAASPPKKPQEDKPVKDQEGPHVDTADAKPEKAKAHARRKSDTTFKTQSNALELDIPDSETASTTSDPKSPTAISPSDDGVPAPELVIDDSIQLTPPVSGDLPESPVGPLPKKRLSIFEKAISSIRRLSKKDASEPANSSNVSTGNNTPMASPRPATALKPADIEEVTDFIERLLKVARLFQGHTGSFILNERDILRVCDRARQVFLSETSLLQVKAPVKIVGDTHGQYRDLIRLFDLCGYPSATSTPYLFLGDYVDRGKQSLETIMLLLCYKIKFPDKIFLLRGNHECASVNRVYGFFDECKRRSTMKVWRTFTDLFNTLPIAAVVANKIFCVHGGISPVLMNMTDVNAIQRPIDIPEEGLLNDLLWSDPSEEIEGWDQNDRGVSYVFGKKAVQEFLRNHDLDLVCRAHMVVEDGYEFFADRGLVTVFSAPNYCGEFDNNAAVMNVDTDLVCSFDIVKAIPRQQLQ